MATECVGKMRDAAFQVVGKVKCEVRLADLLKGLVFHLLRGALVNRLGDQHYGPAASTDSQLFFG